jgi:hypothetical protein
MISKDKTYRTRDGREVRIYATDGNELFPIHGAVKVKDAWSIELWDRNGKTSSGSTWRDLIEVKPRIKRTVWLNVYPPNVYTCDGANTKSGADSRADYNRLACVKVEIDVEEGEGL